MIRKTALVVAVLGSLSGSVYAQSSVTLYGIVSANITYSNDVQTAAKGPGGQPVGAHQIAQMDGGATGMLASRWGLSGVEDLGGGMRALFKIENGFSINNGTASQGGDEFGRQAWVGLSAPAGTVSLGRQSDSTVDLVSPLTYCFNWGYFNAHPDDYDNVCYTKRINNSIKYASPKISGFQFVGIYSFGGIAGNFTQNQLWSAGVGYSSGSFSIAASYVNARNPNISLYGTNANATTTGNNMGSAGSSTAPQSNPVFAGFASASTTGIFATAASYAAGPLNFGLAYSNTQFKNIGSVASLNPYGYSGTAAFNNYEASVRYQMTPMLRFGFAFDYTQRSSLGSLAGAHYQQFNLGVDYFLSKSTDVYAGAAYQRASGTDSLGQPAVASITGLSPSASNRQAAAVAGLKHTF